MAVDLLGDVKLVRRFAGMRVVGSFPPPYEVRDAQWTLLKGRFVMERMGRLRDQMLEARVRFCDITLKGVSGLFLTADKEVSAEMAGWKQHIPENIKSLWASFWEEATTKAADDERGYLSAPTRLSAEWYGQDVVGVFPPMTDMQEEVRRLLKSRYVVGRDTSPDQLLEAREEFVLANLQSVEGFTLGEDPLTPDKEDWMSYIPLGVVSGWAQYFEEGSGLTEGEEKN